MTAAERKKVSRAKRAVEGEREFMVTLGGATLHFVEGVAQAGNISKAQAVTMLLELVIAKVYGEAALAQGQIDSGEETQEAALARLVEMLQAPKVPVSMKALFGEELPQSE